MALVLSSCTENGSGIGEFFLRIGNIVIGLVACVLFAGFFFLLSSLFRQILSRSTFSSIKMQEKKVACIKLLSRVLIWTLFLFFEGEWHTWSGMEKVSKNSEFFWSFSLDQRWNDRAIQV